MISPADLRLIRGRMPSVMYAEDKRTTQSAWSMPTRAGLPCYYPELEAVTSTSPPPVWICVSSGDL